MMYNSSSVKRSLKRAKLRSRLRRFENFVRRAFKLCRFILVLALLYGLYSFAESDIWHLPENMFQTGENIKFSGNSIVSNKRILQELRKTPFADEPLYMINPEPAVKALEKLTPVKKAYIRRYIFPARIEVMIEEEIPALIIAPADDMAEIAAYSFDGVLIKSEFMPLAKKGRAFKVLSLGSASDSYEKWDLKKIHSLYRLADLLEYYSGEKLKYLDLRKQNNAFAQLETFKVRLGVLDYNVFERIKPLSSMMKSEEIKQLAPRVSFIDLSWSQVQYLNTGGGDLSDITEITF